MKITILTLFPDMFTGVFQQSILKQAQEKRLVEYNVVNFRDFSLDKHQRVDDYPYGGGAGMVLTPQPLFDAVESVKSNSSSRPRIVLLCPQGERYNQEKAEEFAKEEELILICGHYEGYDERIREHLATDEVSIGDYILTGGEIGAMTVVDSVTRLIPGVLGNKESAIKDSFSSGLLEHPHYTRPAKFLSYEVPEVLLSGHHANINKWRHRESLRRTYERRPDLLEKIYLSASDKEFLSELDNKSEK